MSNKSFNELVENNTEFNKLRTGSLVTGEVLKVFPNSVLVYTGLKSESFVKIDQFLTESGDLEINEGDKLEFVLEEIESGNGETKISREKAKQTISWHNVKKAHENNETIEGTILNKVKGGFSVDIDGLSGFLPGSLADVRQQKDANIEGKKLQFKIIKMDSKRNNIVLSHRGFLEQGMAADAKEVLDKIFEGKVVKGVVKNLTEYGAFIDLGSVDGLLHITDMRWKRVNHPTEVVNIGDNLELVVLKFEKEKSRISLGLKQLTVDPWENVHSRYQIGEKIKAEVNNVTDYGFFVTLDDGIEGLVHISEMSWSYKNINPHKIVKVGDIVDVQILGLDDNRHRVSLGMKQCTPNPWKVYAENHNKGDIVDGVVSSVTEFGVFVELGERMDGLIHINDLSWEANAEEYLEKYTKGMKIKVQILNIDIENQKVSIGVKQLTTDYSSEFMQLNPKNSIVSGKIVEFEGKKVLVKLSDKVMGEIKSQEVINKETGSHTVKVDDVLEFRVLGYDKKTNRVNLSHQLAQEASSQEIREYNISQKKESESTIGSIIKTKLGFGKSDDSD